MDILISSNLERLLYYASGQNTAKVAAWMEQLQKEGFYTLDDETRQAIQSRFQGGFYDDEALKKTIAQTFEETGYVLDPHSAAAFALARESKTPVIALSTASPYKFTQDVLDALGIHEEDPWKAMEKLAEKNADTIPAPLQALKEAEIRHKAVISPAEMKESTARAAREIFQ